MVAGEYSKGHEKIEKHSQVECPGAAEDSFEIHTGLIILEILVSRCREESVELLSGGVEEKNKDCQKENCGKTERKESGIGVTAPNGQHRNRNN